MTKEDWERSVEEMFQYMHTPEWAEAAKRIMDLGPGEILVDLRNWSDKG